MRSFSLLIVLALSAPALAQSITNGPSGTQSASPSAFSATTAPLDLYVDPTGSDGSPCTAAAPCATIQVAINKVPRAIYHPVTVHVAAGTYAAGAVLDGFVFGRAASLSSGAYLRIQGSYDAPTLTSGVTSCTASAVTAGSAKTWGTVACSAPGWTASDLRGHLVRVSQASGPALIMAIDDNTTTTLTVAGPLKDDGSLATPSVGATVEILDPAAIITGSVSRGAVFTANAQSPVASSSAQAWLITGIIQASESIASNLIIEGFRYTGTRAASVSTDTGVSFRFSRFDCTGTSDIGLGHQAQVEGVSNVVNLVASGSFINQSTGTFAYARRISVQGNVVNGASNADFVVVVSGHGVAALYDSVKNIRRAFRLGTQNAVFFSGEHWTSCSENCAYANGSIATSSAGTWLVQDTTVTGFTTSAFAMGAGPIFLRFDVSGSGTSGSGTGCAIRLSYGAQAHISASTSITGTSGDVCFGDGTTKTLTQVRAGTVTSADLSLATQGG